MPVINNSFTLVTNRNMDICLLFASIVFVFLLF